MQEPQLQTAEIFKPYKDTNYTVSNFGTVKNSAGKIIKPYYDRRGWYWKIDLRSIGKNQPYIHKMVAETFLENTDPEKTDIHHIDNDTANNCVWNLEYVTHSKNMWYKKINQQEIKRENKNIYEMIPGAF